ncbi:MAG: transcriptional regulator [Chloroflexi bacterium]|nr:transcriptional regulator [Chloroflexota bacterium]
MSLRLKDDQVTRLERAARHLGRTPSETAVVLLEEALRQRDFAYIEFRDTFVGRQAYIKGSRLAVWHVAMIARHFDDPVPQVAAHLEIPERQVAAALAYAAAFPDEIESAVADNDALKDDIQRSLPGIHVVTFDAPPP